MYYKIRKACTIKKKENIISVLEITIFILITFFPDKTGYSPMFNNFIVNKITINNIAY